VREGHVAIIGILKRCEIFLGLDDTDLQRIVDLPSCECRSYQAEAIVFRAGEKAERLYVLEEGQIDLLIKGAGTSPYLPARAVICSISKGGIFGWPALVPPHVFSLTAICKSPSTILSIRGEELRRLFQESPHIGLEVTNCLLRVISSRFRYIEQLLVTGKKSPLFEIHTLSAE